MSKVQILRSGASSLTLAVVLAAAPAFAQSATPATTSAQTRPATAGDRAPEDAQTPAQAAAVATNTKPGQPSEEIIVTGTSIRGVAPVGSDLISIGRDTIEDTGSQTVQQILQTVPAVVGMGSAGQGSFGSADASGTNAPTIHGLGASASNSTLVIVDGHRIPLAGVNHALGDPNMIPPIAIQRVEVLPDGASSTYGSDAVAGVINFITRSHFNGVEADAQIGFADQYKTWQAAILAGHTWDTGSILVAYSYSHRDDLMFGSRDFLVANRIALADAAGLDVSTSSARGRANGSDFFCSPASVQIGSTIYQYNAATGTYGNPISNAQENANCDLTSYGDVLPEEKRNNLFAKMEQQIGDRLTVSLDFAYSNRKDDQLGDRGTLRATVFGPGSNPPGGAGQINPFFVPIPGTTATSYTVLYHPADLLGHGQVTLSQDKTWYTYAHAEYNLSDTWQASAGLMIGNSDDTVRSTGNFCTSCAILALNGTTQANGSVTTPSVVGQNYIVTNLPLTTANALDVWHLGSANGTSSAVVAQLTDYDNTQHSVQGITQLRAQLNGDLFALSAGAVKLALGAEYLDYTISQDRVRPLGIGPATGASTSLHLDYKRNVKSAYAELFVPLVGPDAGIPLVYSFDLDLAGRVDDYSDFGTTTNPKIAANWEITPGVKLRGNWGKSFVAPALTSRGADQYGTTAETSISAGPTNLLVPISNFPTVTQIPGVKCDATNCTLGTGNILGLQINGGDANLKPQTGTAWSAGVDFQPHFLTGLRASVTYWHNTIKGGITAPTPAFGVIGLPDRLQIFPQGLTPGSSELNAIIGPRAVTTVLPGKVYYTYDFRQGNVLNIVAEGVDAQVRYAAKFGWGGVDGGLALSQKTKFDQSFGTGPVFSVLGTSGFNTTFPSIRTELRGDVGAKVGGFSARLFANYTGPYKNWSRAALTPVESEGPVPIGGGDPVKSQTTFDLHVGYDLAELAPYLPKANVYVDVQNLFDTDPSFYNGTNSYNTFTSSPIGRLVSVGIRANW